MALAAPDENLLERDDAFGSLDAELERALLGSARVVVVAGAAGIGKSSLIRAFETRHANETRTVSGTAEALLTPRPLGPVRAIARALGVADELPTSLAERGELFDALAGELRTHPTIAVLDDMHLADSATVAAVDHLAAHLDSAPVLLLLAFDSAAPIDAAASSSRVFLWPLTPGAVDSLAERAGRAAHGLYETTGGNPFFVTEVLAGEGGDVPETIEAAVLARADRLSPGGRRLLEAAAIVPPSAEVWLLQAIADEDFEHLAECLSTGVLVPTEAGIGFRHELARIAVEHTLASERRHALNERAVRALVLQSDGPADPVRIAHHADAAGDADGVLRFAPIAATEAARVGAHREAAEHYARALSYHPNADRQRLALLEGYADELDLTGGSSDSSATRGEAAEIARAIGAKDP